jgi:hypothetical protein
VCRHRHLMIVMRGAGAVPVLGAWCVVPALLVLLADTVSRRPGSG